MPADETMLAQHTVDFRNEERHAANQIAICAGDEYCQADVDEHDPGCPVEARLRAEYGF